MTERDEHEYAKQQTFGHGVFELESDGIVLALHPPGRRSCCLGSLLVSRSLSPPDPYPCSCGLSRNPNEQHRCRVRSGRRDDRQFDKYMNEYKRTHPGLTDHDLPRFEDMDHNNNGHINFGEVRVMRAHGLPPACFCVALSTLFSSWALTLSTEPHAHRAPVPAQYRAPRKPARPCADSRAACRRCCRLTVGWPRSAVRSSSVATSARESYVHLPCFCATFAACAPARWLDRPSRASLFDDATPPPHTYPPPLVPFLNSGKSTR